MTPGMLLVGRLVMSVGGPLGPSDIDPDDIRDVACDVTAGSATCNPPAPSEPTPPSDFSSGGGGGALGQLLVLLLVVALAVAIVWLISRWRRGETMVDDGEELDDGDLDESVDEEIGARVIDRETPPERWRRLAAEHREQGRFRDAIRCEYRALVGDLARAGYVDEIPGRTSGEERTQVAEIAPRLGAAGDTVARDFAVAADTFDVAWFDDDAVTGDDDVRFLDAQRSVLDGVGARR